MEFGYEEDELAAKSSTEEIRARFDADVDRFSNLETGQAAAIDAPLMMDLISESAVKLTPRIERVLDVGCGAGNNSLMLFQKYASAFQSDLLDLSRPMLERAETRLKKAGIREVSTWHADIRQANLPAESFDVIIAAAVLHHLRDEEDWLSTFSKIFSLLRPGGSFWVSDLVSQETSTIHELIWKRYEMYLETLGGKAYCQRVMEYIALEDSPRPLTYQLDLMREVGFTHVEVLHKNSCFAAFGGLKS